MTARQSNLKQHQILVVEDEALTAEDLREHLQHCGYAVSATVASAGEALALLEGTRPDLVLMDIVLEGAMDGIDLAVIIKSKYHIPVVFLTAYTDRQRLERARLAEPYGYLVKPFAERELCTTIDMALYKSEVDGRMKAELERQVAERTRELEDANRGLREAKERAEMADRAKSRFLANMGHELRTPLNPAIGYATLLAGDKSLGAAQRESATQIVASCRTLLVLIENLLEVARSDSGELRLRPGPFQLLDVLGRLAQAARKRAERRGLAFELLLPEAPPSVLGDAQRLSKVLELLLDNAFKFTAAGRVAVKLELPPGRQHPAKVHFRICVEDTGCGIAAEQQARIFEPFYQVDDSSTRLRDGAGIGLTLARRLVQAMGGAIGVESTPGAGSRFWIELSLPTADVR